ncbi:hypothetical protein [Paenibacillus hubeiensis]|uniref:hypothetical protein n=1 Tax=Paenibacillus hubeiensis TaxID=3077330 RepID=UPI0031B9D391
MISSVEERTWFRNQVYPIPAGPDGKIGTKWQSSGVNASIMINNDAKHPEAIFLYCNYLLDNQANPAADSEYEYGFAKGYDWDIVDGEPTSIKTRSKTSPTSSRS